MDLERERVKYDLLSYLLHGQITHLNMTTNAASTGWPSWFLMSSTMKLAVAKQMPESQAMKMPMQGMDANLVMKGLRELWAALMRTTAGTPVTDEALLKISMFGSTE